MFKDKTIVYTSGTFDMFHYNHLRMINYARSLADILIVGVSTDELVSSYKAKPIIPFHERLQIIEALKRVEGGLSVPELCRELGISSATFYKWRAKYGGLDVSMMARMKELEAENARLKKMYAEERLKADILKEYLGKK